jgi:hypothetical protein
MEPKAQSTLAGHPRDWFVQRERRLAALAERQYGIVARRQLQALGVGDEAIKSRLRLGRLRSIHRGVYAVGHGPISRRGRWLAAVFAYGDRALLSHRSAAALWGLIGSPRGPVDVTSPGGRPGRRGIALHQAEIEDDERAVNAGIPLTSVSRTLVDLAGVLDETRLGRALEEADRLRLLDMGALTHACERAKGRRGIGNLRRLVEEARAPSYPRSPLENRFVEFYRRHLSDLPEPLFNVSILDREVDAYWPKHRLAVEMDSWEFHHHRAAFERDRARDAAFQAAGHRVIRLTHRRLRNEPNAVATQLRALLAVDRDSGD